VYIYIYIWQGLFISDSPNETGDLDGKGKKIPMDKTKQPLDSLNRGKLRLQTWQIAF
jgi:hypothetical protein